MRRYSEAVKADVRRRMSPPHRQSVAQISVWAYAPGGHPAMESGLTTHQLSEELDQQRGSRQWGFKFLGFN